MKCSNLYIVSKIKDKVKVSEEVIDSSFEESDNDAQSKEEEEGVLRAYNLHLKSTII
jgi:hypothetical protein